MFASILSPQKSVFEEVDGYAGVSWNGKTENFFIDPQKTKVN